MIEEIKEEVRQEKLLQFIKKRGGTILALLLIFVLSMVVFSWYRHYKTSGIYKSAGFYHKSIRALEKGQEKGIIRAQDALKQIYKNKDAYGALAALNLSTLDHSQGNIEDSRRFYSTINQNDLGPVLKDMVVLIGAKYQIADGKYEDASRALREYIATDSVFRDSARELLAISCIKENKLDEAIKSLDEIINHDDAPFSLKDRALIFRAMLVK